MLITAPWLTTLLNQRLIRPIDKTFAEFMVQQESQANVNLNNNWLSSQELAPDLLLLMVLLSHALGQNHSCLALAQLDLAQPLGNIDIQLPDLTDIEDKLVACHTVTVITNQDDIYQPIKTPLVLYQRHLYLQRYWDYQLQLASALRHKAIPMTVSGVTASPSTLPSTLPFEQLQLWFNQLFSQNSPAIDSDPQPDWQKVACAIALCQDFCVITGGPGTGKTTTVTNLLALLVRLAQYNQQPLPLIKLVTPTGKAAARLSESIKTAKASLSWESQLVDSIPDEASTIHRLLGVKPYSGEFIHHQDNLLHLDVLVVDEVSMVDLAMMAKLVAALPPRCKLILLGDKDQLPSVEAGSVLADICAPLNQGIRYSPNLIQTIHNMTGMEMHGVAQSTHLSSLSDSICLLQRSYRFDDKSGIGQLAKAVDRGDLNGIKTIQRQQHPNLYFAGVDAQQYRHLIHTCATAYRSYLEKIKQGAKIKTIIEEFNRFQLLAALRQGEYGVAGLNQAIEQQLNQWRLINSTQRYYTGKPIMITNNDHNLQLFNGDVGLVLPDRQTGQLKAWFITPDGQTKAVFPNRLPPHTAVYAMTVHKSQGSEFDKVVMVLPPAAMLGKHSVISKELIYTGITRAKQYFALYSETSVLGMALNSRTQRASQLAEFLYAPVIG